jgi:non-heme chloroperoxidase
MNISLHGKFSVIVRVEYIEIEPNVNLHITDAGEGRPIVVIHGWPLSDEMFKYQYNDLINKNYRVIGITLRGYDKSEKPNGDYDYDLHASDANKVLEKLKIEDAVLVGFPMGILRITKNRFV